MSQVFRNPPPRRREPDSRQRDDSPSRRGSQKCLPVVGNSHSKSQSSDQLHPGLRSNVRPTDSKLVSQYSSSRQDSRSSNWRSTVNSRSDNRRSDNRRSDNRRPDNRRWTDNCRWTDNSRWNDNRHPHERSNGRRSPSETLGSSDRWSSSDTMRSRPSQSSTSSPPHSTRISSSPHSTRTSSLPHSTRTSSPPHSSTSPTPRTSTSSPPHSRTSSPPRSHTSSPADKHRYNPHLDSTNSPLTTLYNEIDSKSCTEYAYVTLVMKGDSYVPGALLLAHSLRKSGTKHHTICMVTPDVSDEAVSTLRLVYTKVVLVDYISAPCKQLRTVKQRDKYKWINYSFTKWQCLNLVSYKKVLFLDADVIVISSFDELFELEAPAGTFSSPWANPFIDITNKHHKTRSRKGCMVVPYLRSDERTGQQRLPRHGDEITPGMIHIGLNGEAGLSSHVLIGTSVLLEPSYEMFAQLQERLNGCRVGTPYGYTSCNNGFDEQIIAEIYASDGVSFRMIHQVFNYIYWHIGWLEPEDVPRCFHFFGKQPNFPWDENRDKWGDLECLWLVASNLVNDYDRYRLRERELLIGMFNSKNLDCLALETCNYCKLLGTDNGHVMFDAELHVCCPELAVTRRMCKKKPGRKVEQYSSGRPKHLHFVNSKK